MKSRIAVFLAAAATLAAIPFLAASASPSTPSQIRVAGIAVDPQSLVEIVHYQQDTREHYFFHGKEPTDADKMGREKAWAFHAGVDTATDGHFLLIRWRNLEKDLDQKERITSVNLARANRVVLVPLEDGKYAMQISSTY